MAEITPAGLDLAKRVVSPCGQEASRRWVGWRPRWREGLWSDSPSGWRVWRGCRRAPVRTGSFGSAAPSVTPRASSGRSPCSRSGRPGRTTSAMPRRGESGCGLLAGCCNSTCNGARHGYRGESRFHALLIAPVKLIRALLPQVLRPVRSERQLCERLRYNLLLRWFVGLASDNRRGITRPTPGTAAGCRITRWRQASSPRCCVWTIGRVCRRRSTSRSTGRWSRRGRAGRASAPKTGGRPATGWPRHDEPPRHGRRGPTARRANPRQRTAATAAACARWRGLSRPRRCGTD